MQVARSAQDEAPRKSGGFRAPFIFSQNQIEAIGLHATGKLRIIDGFRRGRSQGESRDRTLLAEVSSLTVEVTSICRDINSIDEQISALNSVPEQLADVESDA